MNTISVLLIFCLCFAVTSASAQAVDKRTDLIGYFDGRTPCQEIAKELNEPTTPECWKIKWRLTLYKNGTDNSTGTFSLEGFKFRADKVLRGTWNTSKGTKADPNAIVYELHTISKGLIYFLKAADDVLLFLDDKKNILVGNKNFSYALYRTSEE